MQSLKHFFSDLLGPPEEFNGEKRLFHFVVLLSLGLVFYALLFNLFLSNVLLIALFSVLILVGAFLFYISRFLQLFTVSWTLVTVITYFVFILNFILNDGLDGPTLVLSFITITILFTVAPSRMHWLWVSLHILIFGGLVFLELLEPDWIVHNYNDRITRVLDNVITYALTLIFIAVIFRYIRKRIDRQTKDLEQQKEILLENKEYLELSNIKLNKVFGIIAHDIRSPLGSIQGFLEYLNEEDLDQATKDEVHEDLLSLVKQTSGMVDNLLHWSTQQISGVNFQPSDYTLGEVLNTTIEINRLLAANKGIKLITKFDPSEIVFADRDMLEMALRNLIQNAIKFSDKGGRVWLSVQQENGKVEFIVRDEGVGITAAVKEKLFTINTNAQSGTDNEKGVGLGLMLCKEVADAHKGRIYLKSKEGQGAQFTLEIPI